MMQAGWKEGAYVYRKPITPTLRWCALPGTAGVDVLSNNIGEKAYRALLEEVYTTPKPGLVDLYSCGAHTDMDVHTFEKSAEAIQMYFARMARQGLTMRGSAEELFRQIRVIGIDAEETMYRATGNVNTHKGLIFTLGIFCAAVGRCIQREGKITEERLRSIQQEMTARILVEEVRQLTEREAESHGEKNLKKYGTMGIRGEAIAGYPSVWNYALPALREGAREHRDYNLVKLQTLFVLLSRTEDSNILSRQNPEILRQVQDEAKGFLRDGGAYAKNAWRQLVRMDTDYVQKNISAGGCADLLATAIFMQFLLD